ncbi:MAG TPA: ATP-binding cassette domain-containing protein [Bacteroidia bacterium]|nr:ATP-binding cassette domain-containing protein [Bacteroidia bacterium]
MIVLDRLNVAYGTHIVLQSLNWKLEEGRVHGLVGLNGSGKTTLLNTLYGFVRPSTGSLRRNDLALSRKDIAFLETQNYFYPLITGREYLSIFSSGKKEFVLDNWNAIFSLPLDDLIETYSTGMKKKLALLSVFKLNRDIYLLDEPYNGLDLESTTVLKLLLDEYRKEGKTVIVTSHVYETLASVCDQIHHLENGVIAGTYEKGTFNSLGSLLIRTVEERSATMIKKIFS